MERSGKDIQITYNSSLERLTGVLGGVKRPGGYCSAGRFETPMPALAVKGAGTVSFPVPPAQARRLVAAAERAPYGRGNQTLVDEDVRKVWQIPPGRLSLRGKAWERTLQALIAKVADDLGCASDKVDTELYKLLIYDKGGFFAAHRDTEKAPRMFGTLVVTLPSAHEGGDLVIRHAGQETIVSLRNDDPGEIRYAAFYADCEHEVRPVTRGYRVCLVYNLLYKARSRSPVPPDHRSAIDAAVEVLKGWSNDDEEPRKLVYLLEHHYTQSALSFAGLKGPDAARAVVLKEAAARAGCSLHLGIVHIEESGWAEYSGEGYGYYRRRRKYRYWDDDDPEDDEDEEDPSDFEIGEVCDGQYFIDRWRDGVDQPVVFGKIALEDGEVLPAGALDGEKPDRQHFSEATGNEGASFERTYLRAALVLWPDSRYDEICASAGLDSIIARFGQLITATPAEKKATGAARCTEARERASHFLSLLPDEWPRYEDNAARLTRLLRHLARFKDADLIESLLSRLLARYYSAECNSALVVCCRVLGASRTSPVVTVLFTEAGSQHPDGCLDLWCRLASGVLSGRGSELQESFEALVAAMSQVRNRDVWQHQGARLRAMPGDDADVFDVSTEPGKGSAERGRGGIKPAIVVGFVAAVADTLGEAECIRFLDALDRKSGVFTPEGLLLPCLELMAKGEVDLPEGTVCRLWEQCAALYLRRSATPPSEPADWAQPVAIQGSGGNPLLCQLEAFARDPHARERRFPAPAAQRALLHQAIERARLDMTHVTERKGRPYTLVCTKTRASHERALRRYRSDLGDMRRLLALPVARQKASCPTADRLRDALA